VLGDGSPTRFTPPWAPAGRASWPFEQCVAALHAYCCLAAFAGALGGHPAPHTGSLLPVAAHRASVLGEWLHGHGEQLGPDGQSLIGRLTGREFALPPAPTDAPDALADMRAAPHRIATQECGDWTLVMQWSRPATVLWTQTATRRRVVIIERRPSRLHRQWSGVTAPDHAIRSRLPIRFAQHRCADLGGRFLRRRPDVDVPPSTGRSGANQVTRYTCVPRSTGRSRVAWNGWPLRQRHDCRGGRAPSH